MIITKTVKQVYKGVVAMNKSKMNFSIILLLLLSLSYSVYCHINCPSKNNEEITFPLRTNGYPKNDIVLINGQVYPLKQFDFNTKKTITYKEIELKLNTSDNHVNIVLPQNLIAYEWHIEDKKGIHLFSYNILTLPIKKEHILCGEAPDLASFSFTISPEIKDVSFKLINTEEKGKTFYDKKEAYLLTIKIFRQ